MPSLAVILQVMEYGGVLIAGLAIFLFVRNSGANSQILKDKDESEKLQQKINAVPDATPDAVSDKLRNDKF